MVETRRRIGCRVDAAEDGRAPDRRCLLQRFGRGAAILRRTQPVYVRWSDLGDRNVSYDRSSGWRPKYGDRHVVWAQKQSGSKLPHSKRFAPANAPLHPPQRALPCDGAGGHISQLGVVEGPGVQEPGALPVRRLWFRLRRAGKYAG